MKKGISFFWGFRDDSPEQKIKMLSDAGFDSVMVTIEKKFEKENGSAKQQMALFKKYGISPSSLHMRYKGWNLSNFWKKGFGGAFLEHQLKKDVKTAHKNNIPAVVVHLVGEPSLIGLKRLKRILKLCKKLDVFLAIENINYPNLFAYVFENIEHENLKFCYDSGHNNTFDAQTDYLEKYGDKLVCLHLHDNRGSHDDHTLNKYGTINWKKIAEKLAKINFNGSLDYEMIMYYRTDETSQQVLLEVFEQAKELEQMIEDFKKEKH